MANTQWKSTMLPVALRPEAPSSGRAVSFPSPLFRGPAREALRAGDYIPAARRVLLSQHMGGSTSFMVGNVALPAGSQVYPLADTWRVVSRTRAELAPGNALQLRVVAVRSGPTVRASGGAWIEDAIGGAVRASIDYANLDSPPTTASTSAVVNLPASNEANAWEPTTAGGDWSALLFAGAVLVQPAAAAALNPAALAAWSEDTGITVAIEHKGGARVIVASLVEVPRRHVVAHDREQVSIHGFPLGDGLPDNYPQVETRDGASFEDHRFGPARSLIAVERSRERLGPRIAAWSAYAEGLAEVADASEPDPIAVTSKSWVGVSIGSAIKTWSTGNPGHAIAGHYARPMPENHALRLDGAAVLPVRAWVYARFTATGSNTGRVKFQTSGRSWLIVKVPQSASSTAYAWHTITGWIECTAAADDGMPAVQDFAKVTGGTMEIGAWAVDYGEAASAMV